MQLCKIEDELTNDFVWFGSLLKNCGLELSILVA